MKKLTAKEIKAIKKGLEICEEEPTMENIEKYLESGNVRFVYDNKRIFVKFEPEQDENGTITRGYRFTWIDIKTGKEME